MTDGYAPYDPKAVRAEQRVVDRGELFDEDGNPLPSFDEKVREAFEGLLYLGALADHFTWLGHTFTLRTLTQGEVLTVAKVVEPFRGTIGEAKAYTSAMVALAILDVDGEVLPAPIAEGKDEYAWARRRFAYVTENWYEWTIDKVYSRYLELEDLVSQVIEAMEKASGPTGSQAGSSDTSAGPSDGDS